MNKKIKYPLILALLAAATWWGYEMMNLPLWGHRPLFLFVAVWAVIILLLKNKFSAHPKNKKLLLLATLGGILLWLGFPNIPLTFLVFIGFVPILIIEKEIADWKKTPSNFSLFKYSFHAFVVWNILTTYWVANTAFAAGVVAILLNSLFMTIPILLFHQTKKVMNRNMGYLAFIAYWMAWEYLHLRWEISWPWLTLGNSFATFPSWVQWYEYTGVFGGTLWALISNILVFEIVEKLYYKKDKTIQKNVIKWVGWVVIPIIVSIFIYYNNDDKGKKVEVVVVQPNFEPHYEKFAVPRREQLKRFMALSKEALTENTDYLVFPETSFRPILENKLTENSTIRQLQTMVDKYPKLKLIAGLESFRFYEKGEKHGPAARLRKQDSTFYEIHNSAVQLTSGSTEIPIYYKSKLVPGAELLPYRRFLFFFEPLFRNLGGSIAGLGIQKERSVLRSGDDAIAPVICYESVYGEYTTAYIRKGANGIFIVTNDGWWDDTPGHKQHLQLARLRAIETRRSIARSANTGISSFINQRGDIQQATQYEKATAIRGHIALNNEATFYVKWGDILGRIAIFLTIILLLNTIVKRRMRDGGHQT